MVMLRCRCSVQMASHGRLHPGLAMHSSAASALHHAQPFIGFKIGLGAAGTGELSLLSIMVIARYELSEPHTRTLQEARTRIKAVSRLDRQQRREDPYRDPDARLTETTPDTLLHSYVLSTRRGQKPPPAASGGIPLVWSQKSSHDRFRL